MSRATKLRKLHILAKRARARRQNLRGWRFETIPAWTWRIQRLHYLLRGALPEGEG